MSDLDRNAARRLERVGELLHEATPPASLQQHLEGRARLIASVERMRKPSRMRAAGVGLAFAAALAAAALLLVRARGGGPAPIAWHVENGTVGAQGYVSIPPNAPGARLVFDDGSDVALGPGSRGRVASTSASGAEVVLEEGRARVHVQHRDRAHWLVDAGPFAVRVTGTDFTVAWAVDAGTVDVWMRGGRVEVTGPVIGDALGLGPGQHLRARLHEATVQIDAAPEPAADADIHAALNPPPPSTSTSPSPSSPTSTSTPAPTSASFASSPFSWPRLVVAGDFARVVREAETEGAAHALATRPLSDLRALGDAARYAGNPALARRAYQAVRTRFPSSVDARTAAFLLGRVAEEQDHANSDALAWYDRYLAEAPGGAFAGDALGRKMVLVEKTGGRDAARPLAAQYLQRFPNGPYASVARDLAP